MVGVSIMSRIGKKPIPLPKGVKVVLGPENLVTVTGAKGTLQRQMLPDITIVQQDGQLEVTRPDDSQTHRAIHGLSRTLLANMVEGVTNGFTRGLEITGTGYRVTKVGTNLVFSVGYSHPVEFDPPEGITFNVESQTRCSVTGIDKELVGQVAAQIRSIRKPEPYK